MHSFLQIDLRLVIFLSKNVRNDENIIKIAKHYSKIVCVLWNLLLLLTSFNFVLSCCASFTLLSSSWSFFCTIS